MIQRQGALEIHWADQPRLTVLAIDWLRSTLDPVAREIETWTAAEASRLCWSDYASVQHDDQAKAAWLAALIRDGIAFLRGVPQVEQEVENAARLLGYITETNYGRFFDVRETASPNNLAYTSVTLGVHTDNPYREPVPGYQMLHCLIAAAEGGESVFVDGFSVASQLREEDAAAFATLAKTLVQFTFRDAQTDLTAYRRLVKLDDSGCPTAIHYNNRSISTARVPADHAEEFYRAYRSFAHRLRSAQFEFRVTLEPGDLVAFDNHRVLHGRTSFRGSRLLQGCYVAHDGVASSLAVLKRAIQG
ncbi:MAG TPA: TauD/TfdA family dioxygenase [Bryobacteraceae bacterium]